MTRSSCPNHSGTHIFFRPGWNARPGCLPREFPVTSPHSCFLQPGRSHRPALFSFGPVDHTAPLFFSGPVGSLRQALFSLARWGLWWWSGGYIYARLVPPPPPLLRVPPPPGSGRPRSCPVGYAGCIDWELLVRLDHVRRARQHGGKLPRKLPRPPKSLDITAKNGVCHRDTYPTTSFFCWISLAATGKVKILGR